MRRSKLLNITLASSIILGGMLGYSTPSSAASSLGQEVAERAQDYIGYKVTYFDSADFVSYVFDKEGVDVPSSLTSLSYEGKLILDKRDLQVGDIVFFGQSRSNLLAAGIYTGGGKFVVAYKPYDRIKQISLTDDVAKKYFLGAKRVTSTSSGKSGWEATANKVIADGVRHLGVKYKLGADYDKDGTMKFDCSSYTQHVFDQVGIDLYRTSRGQFIYDGSKKLRFDELRKGDLVFFTTEHNYEKYDRGDYRRNGHVGVVKEVHTNGTIEVLHAFPGEGVILEKMDPQGKNYISRAFLYGKRVINDDGTEARDVTMPTKGLIEGR